MLGGYFRCKMCWLVIDRPSIFPHKEEYFGKLQHCFTAFIKKKKGTPSTAPLFMGIFKCTLLNLNIAEMFDDHPSLPHSSAVTSDTSAVSFQMD